MRILLASVDDVCDIRGWSGTPFHLYRALQAAGLDVVLASPLRERCGHVLKVVQFAHNAALPGYYYSRLREPLIVDGYAQQIRRRISATSPDLIIALSTLPVAHLETNVPIVTWTDSTFAGMVDFYPSYTGLSRRYLALGHAMERSALQRVDLAVFSSAWAARSAVEAYGRPRNSVAVVPYGANIASPSRLTASRPADGVCRLLVVGRGWQRKGVDLAVRTVAALRARGVPATLDVVGSNPPLGTNLADEITVHGPLEKDDRRADEQLKRLFERASFFLLPARADCSPIVLAEAQAYGIPVVASDVGGIASMMRPGSGGRTYPLGRFVDDATNLIEGLWGDPARYAAEQAAARRAYEQLLNWDRAVTCLLDLAADRAR
jgi:glycosyltransferase involved in cell wall biosynthesis